MNVIEPAVTENHDDVFRSQHWNNSIYDRVCVLFMKRRPTSLGNCCNDPLWF